MRETTETTERAEAHRTVWGWTVVQGTGPGSAGPTFRSEAEAQAEADRRNAEEAT